MDKNFVIVFVIVIIGFIIFIILKYNHYLKNETDITFETNTAKATLRRNKAYLNLTELTQTPLTRSFTI